MRDAYELWRDGWKATLHELEGIDRIDSDDFGRQHEIGVLAVGRACLSVTGLRWLDLSEPMAREDSYFRSWPTEALRALGECRVAVSSNTVVDHAWRQTRIDPATEGEPTSIAVATIALSVRRYIDSTADKFIGVSRNDRSMHRVATTAGCHRIGQTLVHGIESDLMCRDVKDTSHFDSVVRDLWSRRWQ